MSARSVKGDGQYEGRKGVPSGRDDERDQAIDQAVARGKAVKRRIPAQVIGSTGPDMWA